MLEERNISQTKLAKYMRVSPGRLSSITTANRDITPDTAIRLAKCLGTTPEYWLDLARDYNIAQTTRELGERLNFVRPIDDVI